MLNWRKMTTNPYMHRTAVIGDTFFGREREISRILQLVGTIPPQSVAIFGSERIGKTSILRQLCEFVGPEKLPNLSFTYIDMQGVIDPQSFIKTVTKGEVDDYFSFGEWIEDQEKIIILCLDEFGKTIDSEEFDKDFFDFLRSKAGSGDLALITATLSSLTELDIPGDLRVSRFFNIFASMSLGPLTLDEANLLARMPAQSAGVFFSQEEINYAITITSAKPFQLQRFCYLLFEEKSKENDGHPIDLKIIKERYESENNVMTLEKKRVGPFNNSPIASWLKVIQLLLGGIATTITILFFIAFISDNGQLMLLALGLGALAIFGLGIIGIFSLVPRGK
jgi:hypothetical protein